jgi:outer membrane protein assembly factor BamE (lipoprotein component of BamABCDE complex)
MRAETLDQRTGRVMIGALSLLFVISASGCPFFIPTPGVQAGAPSPEAMHKIEPKVTTRADILMVLGEPDRRAEEDRYFVYYWQETRALIGLILPPGVPVGAGLGARDALALEFGPDGRVTRVKTFSRDMEGLQDMGAERVKTEQLLTDRKINPARARAPCRAEPLPCRLHKAPRARRMRAFCARQGPARNRRARTAAIAGLCSASAKVGGQARACLALTPRYAMSGTG